MKPNQQEARKFTKGPWKAVENLEGNGRWWTIYGNNEKDTIARLAEGESKANALLISKAPELYKALKDLVSVCEGTGRQPPCIENAKAVLKSIQG